MRIEKSIINSSVNIVCLILSFIPNLIVRKIFLTSLGSDMLGLTSLYTNIIGWLSIVELGIGSAIIYSLYKPFADNDQDKIKGYINLYGKFYKSIGFIILVVGLVISPFIKYFIHGNIDSTVSSIGFILYIINTFISYMFSHRLCLLNVAQESYKITIGTTLSKLLIAIAQGIILNIYPNFIIYILIQIIINLCYFIIINIHVSKQYPWINNNKFELEKKDQKSLLKNIKAMFMHKIGSLVVLSTDNIVISKFVGLTSLTIYTNYQIIISALQSISSSILNGITASVGSLISEGNIEKSYNIHKKVFFINFWVSSFLVISLYNTLNQFIVLWVGKENLVSSLTFNILLINMYFSAMRGSVEQFQSGSGQFYQDRYAPLCEAIINLVSSIVLVNYIGLPGVFIGTLLSNFLVIFWTKPYVVYKYVFNKNLGEYFKMYFKYILIAMIPLLVTSVLTYKVKFDYNIISFILNCVINILAINIIYIIIFLKTEEFQYFLNIFKAIFNKKKTGKTCKVKTSNI